MKIPKTPFIFLAAAVAVLALTPLHAANPTATGHANKGVQLSQQGAFDQAVEEFTKAIAADPKDARFYRDRGGVYLTMKRFQDAVNDFTKAIELAPKEHAGYSLRGAAQSELLQLDVALADLNKALEIKPNDPITYASVLTAILTVGAIACYVPARRVLRVDPAIALRAE